MGAGLNTKNLNSEAVQEDSEAAKIEAEVHQTAKLYRYAQDCQYTRPQLKCKEGVKAMRDHTVTAYSDYRLSTTKIEAV